MPLHPVLLRASHVQATEDLLVTRPIEENEVHGLGRPGVVIMYAIDRPSHFEFVAMREIQARQLSVEDLHDLAVKNLPSRVSQVEVHDLGGGMHGLSAGGNLEASLLLVDSLWDQLAARLPGEPLAAVPARDLLFTIGSGQPNAMALISSRAMIDLAEKRYAISQSVLVRRGGKWQAVGH